MALSFVKRLAALQDEDEMSVVMARVRTEGKKLNQTKEEEEDGSNKRQKVEAPPPSFHGVKVEW